MSHTKGRLRIDGFGDVRTDTGLRLRLLGFALSGGNVGVDEAEANTRRIVALWNAAEELGLTTEAIEAGAIQAGAKALDARDRKKQHRIEKEGAA